MQDDKKIRLLTKILAEEVGRTIVNEESCKGAFLKKAYEFQQIESSAIVDFYDGKFHFKGLSDKELDVLMIKNDPSYKEANYIFLKPISSQGTAQKNSSIQFFVTPIALIGDKEVSQLKKFDLLNNIPYNHFSDAILKLLDFPYLPLHFEIYSSLQKGFEKHKVREPNFGFYRPFRKRDKISLGDIIQGSSSTMYYLVDKTRFGGTVKGYRFEDDKLKNLRSNDYTACRKSYIIRKKKCIFYAGELRDDFFVFDDEFYQLLLDIPTNNHNIHVNKFLLRSLDERFSLKLLKKEYLSDGNNFQEYFSCLTQKQQKMITNNIKTLIQQDPAKNNSPINHFLWKEGFEEFIDLESYLELYKKDAERFMNYFEKKNEKGKLEILNELMMLDESNSEIIEWFDQNYPELVRKVGLNIFEGC